MQYCHVTDTTWNPRNPDRYGDIAEGYRQASQERHIADGWRVANPASPRDGFRISKSHPEFSDVDAVQVVDEWIDIAAEQAAQDADAEKAEAAWRAYEDARIASLPSVAALIAENAALKVAAKEQAVRQAKELETLQAALTAARDVAAVAGAVKEWAGKEKSEKDSAAAVNAEVPK
jgi:hypothetical protein